MRAWLSGHAFMAGIALIIVTNAVALAGVAYNRSGEPDSVLRLTDRELRLPYRYNPTSENSGIALRLQWRVLEKKSDEESGLAVSYWGGGAPHWLDEAKLVTLGVRLDSPLGANTRGGRYRQHLSSEVALVLELNGKAYQQALRLARDIEKQAAAMLAASPDDKNVIKRAQSAKEGLERIETQSTRLFIIDAALDEDVLRSEYPDKTRYAIVRGRIRPQVELKDGKAHVSGFVEGLNIEQINVPHAFRAMFEPLIAVRDTTRADRGLTFSASVAFGRRFEPWIIDASNAGQ